MGLPGLIDGAEEGGDKAAALAAAGGLLVLWSPPLLLDGAAEDGLLTTAVGLSLRQARHSAQAGSLALSGELHESPGQESSHGSRVSEMRLGGPALTMRTPKAASRCVAVLLVSSVASVACTPSAWLGSSTHLSRSVSDAISSHT